MQDNKVNASCVPRIAGRVLIRLLCSTFSSFFFFDGKRWVRFLICFVQMRHNEKSAAWRMLFVVFRHSECNIHKLMDGGI